MSDELLGVSRQDELRTYAWSGACEENKGAKVRSTLVAQCAGGIDQCSHTVGLHSTSNEGASPGCSCAGSFLGLDEFLLRVGGLSAVVGVTEDGG